MKHKVIVAILSFFFVQNISAKYFTILNTNTSGPGSFKAIIDSVNAMGIDGSFISCSPTLKGNIDFSNITVIDYGINYSGRDSVFFGTSNDLTLNGAKYSFSRFNEYNNNSSFEINCTNANRFELYNSNIKGALNFENVDTIVLSNTTTLGISNTNGKVFLLNNHYTRGSDKFGIRLSDYKDSSTISLIDPKIFVQNNDMVNSHQGNGIEIKRCYNTNLRIQGMSNGSMLNSDFFGEREKYGKAIVLDSLSGNISITESYFGQDPNIYGEGTLNNNCIDINNVATGSILIQNNFLPSIFSRSGAIAAIYLNNVQAQTTINYNSNYNEVNAAPSLSFEISGISANNCSNISIAYNELLTYRDGISFFNVDSSEITSNYIGITANGNTSYQTENHGISIVGDGYTSISNNFIANSGSYGFFFLTGPTTPANVALSQNNVSCNQLENYKLSSVSNDYYRNIYTYFYTQPTLLFSAGNMITSFRVQADVFTEGSKIELYKKTNCSNITLNNLADAYLGTVTTSGSIVALDLSSKNLSVNEELYCIVSDSLGRAQYISGTLSVDEPQGPTLFVSNSNNSGEGSFSAALDSAEQDDDLNVIVFADNLDSIAVTQTIQITKPVTLVQMSSGSNGLPKIIANVPNGQFIRSSASHLNIQHLEFVNQGNTSQTIEIEGAQTATFNYSKTNIPINFSNCWVAVTVSSELSEINASRGHSLEMQRCKTTSGRYMAIVSDMLINSEINITSDSLGINNSQAISTDFDFGLKIENCAQTNMMLQNSVFNGINNNLSPSESAVLSVTNSSGNFNITSNKFGFEREIALDGNFTGHGIYLIDNNGNFSINSNIFNSFANGSVIYGENTNYINVNSSNVGFRSQGLSPLYDRFLTLINSKFAAIEFNDIGVSQGHSVYFNNVDSSRVFFNYFGSKQNDLAINTGSKQSGLVLSTESSNNVIKQNNFLYNNDFGIIDSSNNNTIGVNYFVCNGSGMINSPTINLLQDHFNNYPDEYLVNVNTTSDSLVLNNLPFEDGTKVYIYKTLNCQNFSFESNELRKSFADSLTIINGQLLYEIAGSNTETENDLSPFKLFFVGNNGEIIGTSKRIIYPSTVSTQNVASQEPSINIFPNPSTGSINIVSEKNGEFSIFDVHGKLVKRSLIAPNQNNTIVISTPGVYFIAIKQNGVHHKQKIIIN